MKPEFEPDADADPEFESAAAAGADFGPEAAAWMKLAAARRAVTAIRGAEEPEAVPPFGFTARVAALAVARRRDSALSRWTAWSLRGALASAMAAAVVAAWPSPAPENASLLRAPAFEIPAIVHL
ncbi:MAG: hypothetical protein V4726_16350 [Verrucomicrobiota bacterium]